MKYNKVNLAIIFDQVLRTGGGYQQALNNVMSMTQSKSKAHYVPKIFTIYPENIAILGNYGLKVELIKVSKFGRVWLKIRSLIYSSLLLKLMGPNEFEKKLINHEIDLVYFLSPSGWSNYLERLNYITTIWDSCHRDFPEFPEVYENRIFETREVNLNRILARSVAVVCDSELGKDNIIRRYNIDQSRIHIVPFSPANAVQTMSINYPNDVKNKFKIENNYIFYPAQFWAHKNHAYVLQGLKALESEYNVKIDVVFSGGNAGNLEYIRTLTAALDLSNQVHFLGFIDNEDVVNLYKSAIALVMPTYFGPTNLPPLEAFTLGTPVLYSDLPGLREQVGDSALLMDLSNPFSMSKHIYNLINDTKLRSRLIESGKKRMSLVNEGNHLEVVESICCDFKVKMNCWKGLEVK